MVPKLSIITPNFNKGEVVAETVLSVLNQTCADWELLFIDDGSDDDSFELAQKTAEGDSRCVFLKNTTGIKGANAARNMGIDLAKSEFLLFLDSDDLLTPDCVENRLSDFEKYPGMDMLVYSTGIFLDDFGDSDLIFNIPSDDDDLNRFLNRDIVWQTSGPIWKKSSIQSIGGFDLSLLSQQDVDLHVRALIEGLKYTYFHQKPHVYYRQNISSVPRSSSQTLQHFRMRYEMMLRHLGFLVKENKLDEKRKVITARQLLDLAQMMRWHSKTLGKDARKEALKFWSKTKEFNLVNTDIYNSGIKYIRFKHNMLYNRFPNIQKRMEAGFRRKLAGYIFYPSTTHCNSTLADYEG